MPKFLYKINYTADGLKGLIKDGGSKRRQAAEQVTSSVGATIESFYYALGDTDAFLIVDAPDSATAASVALTVGATGAIAVETVALMTPEEIDEATQKSPSYTPPGA